MFDPQPDYARSSTCPEHLHSCLTPDGGWVQTLSGGCYNFDSPAGMAVDGAQVWITSSNIDETGGSVTELNATDGSWICTLSSES